MEPGRSNATGSCATYVLVYTDVSVEEIAAEGKAFKWIRPSCPCGSVKVWGHGFVWRFFAALAHAVPLKRFRCPACRRVFTMKLKGFCRRYQTAGAAMASALEARLEHQGWPRGLSRQRAGHWLRKFLARCRMDYSTDDPLDVLRRVAGDDAHFLV